MTQPIPAKEQKTFKKNLASAQKWLAHQPLQKKAYFVLGTGFGSGLSGKAPGTVGSLAALALIPLWQILPYWSSFAGIGLATIAGIAFCEQTARIMQVHDDGRIVWDEWVGQSITLLPLMFFNLWNWPAVISGFILFRLFDIVKPWPVSWLDKNLDGGFGIMMDDVAAGCIAAACLYLLLPYL